MSDHSSLAIYVTKDGLVELNVPLNKDTVWLSQRQMAQLFNKNVRTINQHIRHIYEEKELNSLSTISKSEIVQQEGNRKVSRVVQTYNLDVIISVGYRIKSQEGTRFRIWATKILRDHLIKGYSFNQNRLANTGIKELEQSLSLIQQTLLHQESIDEIGKEAFNIVTKYAKSWRVLLAYDEDQLQIPKTKQPVSIKFPYEEAVRLIQALKDSLIQKGEASLLFGSERENKLQGILGNIEATFIGQSLYSTVEEKAAHLLYFIIKDHPFTDGNKRIKLLMIKLITNLINDII